jgi:hypothetical protein
MKLKNYLKYSGLWAGIVLNPYHWNFKLEVDPPQLIDTYLFHFELYLGLVWIRIVIDDGNW